VDIILGKRSVIRDFSDIEGLLNRLRVAFYYRIDIVP
jgi:hypothetical protein